MNRIAYTLGYRMLTVVQHLGHRIPKSVLRFWIDHTPTEIECLADYRAGRIDIDRFDFRVDRDIVLVRAYNRLDYRLKKEN